MSAFSDFIRNASKEEKQEVYDKVIKESCLAQRRAMGDSNRHFHCRLL